MSPLATPVFAVYVCTIMNIISAQNILHNNYFDCSTSKAGYILMCNHNQDCSISCTEKSCCKYATIYAPNNANLTLYVGFMAGQSITVYGASNGSLNIECLPWYGCSQAAIYGPTNGNLFLQCNGLSACRSANISCPNNGECDIRCVEGCKDTIINATNMISGSLSVSSISGTTASRIYCPYNNNNCNISCAYRGCENATIYANNDASNLYIDAKDSEALKSSKILCPTGSGACSIKVNATETALDIVSNAKIYAVNGVDFYFICYHLLDVNQCYNNSSKPILFYGNDFTESCVIELESGYNKWQCAHQSIANPTSTIIDTSIIEITQRVTKLLIIDTSFTQTRISSSSASDFISDELATVLIVVGVTLCLILIVVIVFLIWTLFKRRENKRNLKQENKILEVIQIELKESISADKKRERSQEENVIHAVSSFSVDVNVDTNELEMIQQTAGYNDTREEAINENDENVVMQGENNNNNNDTFVADVYKNEGITGEMEHDEELVAYKYNMDAVSDEIVIGEDEQVTNGCNDIDELVTVYL